jgi:hypothetical protein
MAREPEKSARDIGKSKTEATAGLKSGGNGESAEAKAGSLDGTELMKEQHRGLQATLAKRSEANADHDAIVREFAAAWLPHVVVERDILAPALKNAGIDEENLVGGAIQRDIINWLLADLLRGESREFGAARLEALAKQFDAHVESAEAEETGRSAILSSAETANPGLTAQMKARYERLKSRFANMDESIGEAMSMLAPRRLSVPPSRQRNRRESEMNRYSNNTRERDDQGRFMSEDDNGYSRGSRSSGRDRDDQGRFMSEGGGYSRSRYDNDDDRRYSRGGPERDENGRFMSEGGSRGRYDEDQRYAHRSTGRDRDDEGRFTNENGSSRGRFQGDDEHYGPRSLGSMGRDRDDEGRFTRSGGSYDDRRHGGWFGDSERHSESSRRGWDSPRHGESGWYGDPEGHSEASRRGWDGREGGGSPRYEERSRRYDEAPSRSRSQYADDRDYRRSDDNERGNGGRGHGGWSGDPEGHSEASRRGWQNRR